MAKKTEFTNDDKNRKYVRFNRDSLMDIAALGDENPSAFEVFMFIAKNMGTNNALCISMKTLEEALGLSESTLNRAIKYLEENKWIIIQNGSASAN